VSLTLEPSVVSVGTDETFQISLAVDARVPVSHLPTTITYDASRLAVERVDAGDFLGGSGSAQVLADTSTPGSIVIGASRLGQRPGVAGHGKVATITFRSIEPGSSPIQISARRVLDPALLEISSVGTVGAAVEVRAPIAAASSPP
jgi:hypothetical protein